MNLVFDTSLLIDSLRGGKLLEDICKGLGPGDKLFLPTIVMTELFSGLSSRDLRIVKKIRFLVDNFEEILLTESIAEKVGVFIRDLGKIVEMPDFIVAASAIEVGAQVVTLNQKHFQKIPGVAIFAPVLQ